MPKSTARKRRTDPRPQRGTSPIQGGTAESRRARVISPLASLGAFIIVLAFNLLFILSLVYTYLPRVLPGVGEWLVPLVAVFPGVISMWMLRDWRTWWMWVLTAVTGYLSFAGPLAVTIGATWAGFRLWYVDNKANPLTITAQWARLRAGNAPSGFDQQQTRAPKRTSPARPETGRDYLTRGLYLAGSFAAVLVAFQLASILPLSTASVLLLWPLVAMIPGLVTVLLLRDARPLLWWLMIVALSFSVSTNLINQEVVYLALGTAALYQSWFRERRTTPWAVWKGHQGAGKAFARPRAPRNALEASQWRYARLLDEQSARGAKLATRNEAQARKRSERDKVASQAATDKEHGR